MTIVCCCRTEIRPGCGSSESELTKKNRRPNFSTISIRCAIVQGWPKLRFESVLQRVDRVRNTKGENVQTLWVLQGACGQDIMEWDQFPLHITDEYRAKF